MPLIICPKTTSKVMRKFVEILGVRKVPSKKGRFWHGNFNDFLYESLDSRIKVLFTGYSGAVAGQAIFEYDARYRGDDVKPEIYFVGSLYAFRDSQLEPGNLTYAEDSYSPDSFEMAIYENAKGRGIKDIGMPDAILLSKIQKNAMAKNIRLKPARVYCRISPGVYPEFQKVTELMHESMWWKMSLSPIMQGGFNSGEYESASVLATSKLLGIPAVALMDVKDKRYSASQYVIATNEQKGQALNDILSIIENSVNE